MIHSALLSRDIYLAAFACWLIVVANAKDNVTNKAALRNIISVLDLSERLTERFR